MRLLVVVLLAWLALSGCTAESPSAESDAPTPSPTEEEPSGYRYVLRSYCGYPALGTLAVVERGGIVRQVSRVGEPRGDVPAPGDVPSLAEILARAEAAPRSADVEVVLDEGGLPASVRIDDPRSQDSDECYQVSDLEPLP